MNKILTKFKGLLRALGKGEMGLATIPTIVAAISTLAVAGTLANTVINQGSDVTQDVEKVVQEAVQNVQSAYQIKGSLIGIAASTGSKGTIGQLTFTIALVSSSGCVDFTPPIAAVDNSGLADPASNNTIVISYTDEYQNVENLYWTLAQYGKNDGDNLLEVNELFQITIGGSPTPGKDGGNLLDALSQDLSTDTAFNIQVKAPQGIVMRVDRRTPSSFNNIINFGY